MPALRPMALDVMAESRFIRNTHGKGTLTAKAARDKRRHGKAARDKRRHGKGSKRCVEAARQQETCRGRRDVMAARDV